MDLFEYRRSPLVLLAFLWALSSATHGQISLPVATTPGSISPAGQAIAAATTTPAVGGIGKSLPNAAAANLLPVPAFDVNKATSAIEGEKANTDAPNPEVTVKVRQSTFQRFVQQATGQALPIFGEQLFTATSGYTPVSAMPVPHNYILGPGDEIRLQIWGAVNAEHSMAIDRNGQVNLPRVGVISLAGVRAGELENVLRSKIGRIFTNFSLNATLGRLRSIQIYVVGQARQPGTYTISSLSTLINALFEVGGPNNNGSMRNIKLRRDGRIVGELDLYKFIVQGDRAGDVSLLPGDVIVIPPAGPRVAVLGAFDQPAIFELKDESNIGDVIELGGGVSALTSPGKTLLERIDPNADKSRQVIEVALDKAGMKTPLRDGDILTMFEISPQFSNAVTLSGNVAGPMRYPYRPGMRVTDLVSNNSLLVPVSYWLGANAGKKAEVYSKPEVNLDYATIQRLDIRTLRTEIIAFNLSKALLGDSSENLLLQPGDLVTVYAPNEPGSDTINTINLRGEMVGGIKRFAWRPGFKIKDIIPSTEWLVQRYNYWQKPSGKELRNDINWDFAQVIRRVPQTLETRSLAFSLGRAVMGENPADNIQLEPGDQIILYTTDQMATPVAKRARLVTVSGEVATPGIYQTTPGETLPELIKRVGGVTPDAYVYGTTFTRESVRAQQQKNLDLVISKLEDQMQGDAAVLISNAQDDTTLQRQQAIQLQQQQRLKRLKNMKSNGRVSLDLRPGARHLVELPSLPLEDGDAILVPTHPGFVSAAGEVFSENALIYREGKTVGDVLAEAGVNKQADQDNIFVIRADGSVSSASNHSGMFGLFNGFEGTEVMPGDTVVVPTKLDRETGWTKFVVGLKDWSQIFYQLGLGVAAWKTLK